MQKACEIGYVQYMPDISEIGQCTRLCNDKPECAGFSYSKEECAFFDETCTATDPVEDDEATTYVKN